MRGIFIFVASLQNRLCSFDIRGDPSALMQAARRASRLADPQVIVTCTEYPVSTRSANEHRHKSAQWLRALLTFVASLQNRYISRHPGTSTAPDVGGAARKPASPPGHSVSVASLELEAFSKHMSRWLKS